MPWAALALIYGFAFVGMIVFYMVPVQLPFYLEQRLVPPRAVRWPSRR
jgi:ABC-type phosphate/phosphonate transport system permease subunit